MDQRKTHADTGGRSAACGRSSDKVTTDFDAVDCKTCLHHLSFARYFGFGWYVNA